MGGWLLATTVTVAIVIASNLLGSRNRRAIERAQAESRGLEVQRDSLTAAVRDREQQQTVLTAERDSVEGLARNLRDSVAFLERSRSAAQLTVRQIRTVGALQQRLRDAFPELGRSAWGVTTIPIDRRDTVGIEYLTVPAWFAETFIIDHANAESWRAQKDQLLAVDSLRLVVIALQDSVTTLVAASAEAYRHGYQAAYAGYQDLSKRYVAELKRPFIRLPSALGLVGALGAGLVVGSTLPW